MRLSIVLGTAMLCVAAGAAAQQATKFDMGGREYDSNCAGCHGPKGAGDGSYIAYLNKTPPDLRTIAKRNGGVFPLQRVFDVIDGRESVTAHGPREMPIWGADYVAKAGEHLEYYPELFARTRILALIDYLYRIQAK